MGIVWDIPEKYLAHSKKNMYKIIYSKNISNGGERIEIRVTESNLTPIVLGNGFFEKPPSNNFTTIIINPMQPAATDFSKLIDSRFLKSSKLYEKTDFFRFGLRAYIRSPGGTDVLNPFLLIADSQRDFYMKCTTDSRINIFQYMDKKKIGCIVTGNVDNLVMFKYYIQFDKLDDFSRVHASIITVLHGFMKNQMPSSSNLGMAFLPTPMAV